VGKDTIETHDAQGMGMGLAVRGQARLFGVAGSNLPGNVIPFRCPTATLLFTLSMLVVESPPLQYKCNIVGVTAALV
jgi:hypothetical protein